VTVGWSFSSAVCVTVPTSQRESHALRGLIPYSMEPAKGLEPLTSGLRKRRSTVPRCIHHCAPVNFLSISTCFLIPRFAIVLLGSQ